ncbi:hypothetical protein CONLIGDRAFT_675672 [Coniochaeta ligniaria NRRL 30616]|uniref:Uncharacterized protein n=1 Tax=Coniochaeta ligniaria NRRL 30616 TaxID=1408157 RepID=A0A1J7J4M5_9PEZI|nr:hypothetical protein CONLIGDRAFT_675672 [Coniochaeta ligniaria NRRL 30616]
MEENGTLGDDTIIVRARGETRRKKAKAAMRDLLETLSKMPLESPALSDETEEMTPKKQAVANTTKGLTPSRSAEWAMTIGLSENKSSKTTPGGQPPATQLPAQSTPRTRRCRKKDK